MSIGICLIVVVALHIAEDLRGLKVEQLLQLRH
jgi:hypothetical protein